MDPIVALRSIIGHMKSESYKSYTFAHIGLEIIRTLESCKVFRDESCVCRGKKETLCGNCNGAGFLGGFMS